VAIGAGNQHTCSVSVTGGVRSWGTNFFNQLGSPLPDGGFGVTNAMAVAVVGGDSHTCAVRANGTIICWGGNAFGQLGNDSFLPSVTPVSVRERRLISCPIPPGVCSSALVLTEMVSVEAGNGSTCAMRADGQPFCWGADGSGQIGNGTPNQNQGSAQRVASFSITIPIP
jgi:alpha-tubulin suppressor-like RCC1 family protein